MSDLTTEDGHLSTWTLNVGAAARMRTAVVRFGRFERPYHPIPVPVVARWKTRTPSMPSSPVARASLQSRCLNPPVGVFTSGLRHEPPRDSHRENPTENPTDQSDTTGRIRHHRTSFLANPDESDTTGPFRPFAATS